MITDSLKKWLFALSKRPLLGKPLRALSRKLSGGHSSPSHIKPAYLAHNQAQLRILAAFEAKTSSRISQERSPH